MNQSFAAQMEQAKCAKLARRNRGESIGDHRGQMAPRVETFDMIEVAGG
jgi:hypothetical protein